MVLKYLCRFLCYICSAKGFSIIIIVIIHNNYLNGFKS